MDVGWHYGIGDTRWWNAEAQTNLHWGTVDGSNNQYTEIGSMTLTDIKSENSAIGKLGIYGSDDHPSLTSTSGKPYLYVTSSYLLGRISLNADDTVDSIETLGKLPGKYPGDVSV